LGFEEEVEALADVNTRKWLESMKMRGKKVTEEGLKRYRESARGMARWKLGEKERREKRDGGCDS